MQSRAQQRMAQTRNGLALPYDAVQKVTSTAQSWTHGYFLHRHNMPQTPYIKDSRRGVTGK